jgi:cytochrome b561
MQKPSSTRYTNVAIALHWLLALMIIGSLSFGLYMVDLPFSPARVKQYNWHKWAGITILILSAVRLLWRLKNPPPPLAADIANWQAQAAHWAHRLLYILFFALPLAGWAYSSAAGFPVVYFGIIPLPNWVPVSAELADTLKLVHRWLAYTLASLICMHIVAAFFHQLTDDHGLLERMIPKRKDSA